MLTVNNRFVGEKGDAREGKEEDENPEPQLKTKA